MKRTPLTVSAALAWAFSQPALAHVTGSAQPHWHASDTLGLTAVALLMAGAVWLDRRSK